MAGNTHFCEVFFDGASTAADLIVGKPCDGWQMAMATLGFDRGTAFVAQLERYGSEFQRVVRVARERGTSPMSGCVTASPTCTSGSR